MLFERHTENASYVPARALNLICVVDKEWSGEIANRLRQVGRYHASRTVVLEVEDKRTSIDAVATIASDVTQMRFSARAGTYEAFSVWTLEEHLAQRGLDRVGRRVVRAPVAVGDARHLRSGRQVWPSSISCGGLVGALREGLVL